MIRQIFDGVSERLTDSYYGRKIMAAYLSYGAEYDFCRFYSCENPDGSGGIIHVFYASMIVDGNVSREDAETFIRMFSPVNIEASGSMSLRLEEGYWGIHRTMFRAASGDTDIRYEAIDVNNRAAECFRILRDSFENMGEFDRWYVDMSHRIRHKTAELYLYGGTTVTKAFDVGGFAFLSHIATASAERGKGGARRLLYCISKRLEAEGKSGYLFALDHRRSFYSSIGFEAVGEDIFYEFKM